MAVIAFDVKSIREYTLKADGGEDKTIFLIGVIDSRLSAYLSDHSTSFGVNGMGADANSTVQLDVKQKEYQTVRFGLKGWRNLKTKDGADVEFRQRPETLGGRVGERMAVTHECMDLIKPFISELAAAIAADNIFTEDELKN